MNVKHEQIYHRSRLVVLGTLLATLALILASCGTMPRREGLAARASVGAGVGHVRGETTSPTTGEEESESAYGSVVGVRAEVTSQPDEFRNLAVGLRFQGNLRRARADGLGSDGTGELELDTAGAEGHAVFRGYFPINESVRPFAEVFGGVAYTDGELTASGGGLSGPLSDGGGDWSAVGGAGLGVEFDVSSSASMFVQGDYSVRLGEVDPFSFRLQDVMLWVGGEIRF